MTDAAVVHGAGHAAVRYIFFIVCVLCVCQNKRPVPKEPGRVPLLEQGMTRTT